MIPFRVVGKDDFRPYVTFFLTIAILLVFFWEVALTLNGGQPIDAYLSDYAFVPCEIGQQPIGEIAVDGVRALFMTTNFLTMLVNFMFLWIFAPSVEKFMGSRRFLSYYVTVGVGGYLFSSLLGGGSCDPLVGPNSAIAGVIAAFVFLYPTRKIETLIQPLFFRRFDFPAFFFAIAYLAIQFLEQGEGPLSGNFAPVWDEIGGFLLGFIIIFLWTAFFKPAPEADPFEHLDD